MVPPACQLFSVQDFQDGDISRLFYATNQLQEKTFPEIQKASPHAGQILATLFFEPSTRTRISFEVAAHRLGMHVVSLNPFASSLQKGESIGDTIRTICAMRPDILVVRSQESLANYVDHFENMRLINGGDGCHEHPTQAMIDAYTLFHTFGGQFDKLEGKKVAIIGDLRHSRVANSNLRLLRRLGVITYALAPAYFMPELRIPGVTYSEQLDAVLPEVDAVILLRIQHERLEQQLPGSLLGSHYLPTFGLTRKRFECLKSKAVILHPGPVHWGTELDMSLRKENRLLIEKQVYFGVYMRMALLQWML